ncbi:MAG: DUF86 domain-containing protein [Coleofasciculaceae cyanobacterium SM2_1_6]|nr:DUF86 domain-containing protein [Coleofasciculaceae cyanobacterium SM2_1_6]
MPKPVDLLKLFLEIDEAIRRIERRFHGINEPDDFISSDDGLDRLDGISMMLIAISENIRKIDKIIEKDTFDKYPDVNWSQVKGIRNILAHAYFDIDHDEVYEICASELEVLKQTLTKIRSDIQI